MNAFFVGKLIAQLLHETLRREQQLLVNFFFKLTSRDNSELENIDNSQINEISVK